MNLGERIVLLTSAHFMNLSGTHSGKKFSLSGADFDLDGVEIDEGVIAVSPIIAPRDFSLRLLCLHGLDRLAIERRVISASADAYSSLDQPPIRQRKIKRSSNRMIS